MQKKPYTPPTITEHGNVVKATNGLGGKYWEMYANKMYADDTPIGGGGF